MKINYSVWFWILLALLTAGRVIYTGWGPLDLAPDEAHYWEWSRHPDISYYSKGPLIAYNILIGTETGKLLGISPPNPAFWVRLPAVINSALTGIIIWFLSIELFGSKKTAFYAILVLASMPLYAAGSILMTIDNPLILFWSLFLYFFYIFLRKNRWRWWYIACTAAGAGALSKYTMLIVIPSAAIYLVTSEKHRHILKEKRFYYGIVILMAFLTPVLAWNARHGWIGIRHLAGQAGFSASCLSRPFFSLKYIIPFSGIQAAVVSPVIFVLAVIGLFRAYRRRKEMHFGFLFWTAAPLGIFYLLLSLHKECEANWPAAVYINGAMLCGAFFADKPVLKAGILIGLIMSLFVFFSGAVPNLPNSMDPALRLRGWKELGEETGRMRDVLKKEGSVFIFSDRYQITSELAFYTPGMPYVYCVNLGRRMNQYDLWRDINKLKGQNALYIKHRDTGIEKRVEVAFEKTEKLPVVNIRTGRRITHKYSIFICRKFKGIERPVNEITY